MSLWFIGRAEGVKSPPPNFFRYLFEASQGMLIPVRAFRNVLLSPYLIDMSKLEISQIVYLLIRDLLL